MNIITTNTNVEPTIKAEAAAPAVQPSIMINRIGVFYADKYNKNPQTLIEKCAYFRIHCRVLPHQTIGGNPLQSMKANAAEFYNLLSPADKRQLQSIYNALPEDWR